MSKVREHNPVLPTSWLVLLFLTASSVYLYVFMEWVFFVTKPSFMSGMSLWTQIVILMLSACACAIFPLLLLVLLGFVVRNLQREIITRLLTAIGILIPSLIFASLILILMDNFTYTVFRFGIVSTERLSRAAYGFMFMTLCGAIYFKIKGYLHYHSMKKHPVSKYQWVLVLGFLFGSLFLSILIDRPATGFLFGNTSVSRNLPNIILLGSDGLDANHLSVYGYERDTTPRMKQRPAEALVLENAFPNSGSTAGSIASILTGKLPLETRVIYPPDILRDEDSYQHLPGILKRLGYYTVDLSIPYFGDALTLNVQDGFDIANQRPGRAHLLLRVARGLGGGNSTYFVDTMWQRISDRLLHIFFLKPMINPFEAVIKPAERSNEQNRFNNLISTLEHSDAPVFVHVHMLGTHGPRFEIRDQVFSAGQVQESDWMLDFYDDAILTFDYYVGELFDYLSASGKLDNTVVIVYSDHGMRWEIQQRVPLIFWFPNREYHGRVQGNVQNIDIAPTILDYLGVPVPEWMAGQSLITEKLLQPEYIFSASVDSSLIDVTREGIWAVEVGRRTPPFYQVGYVGLIACNQWYELYVQNPGLRYGEVAGHKGECNPSKLPTPEQAKEILLDHLFQNGYDTSKFPDSIPVEPFP